MALTAKTRNTLPAAAFASPSDRKFPIKKVVKGHLVPDAKHIASATGYSRYASPAAKAKIVAASNALHSKNVATARTNASKPLSSLMARQ